MNQYLDTLEHLIYQDTTGFDTLDTDLKLDAIELLFIGFKSKRKDMNTTYDVNGEGFTDTEDQKKKGLDFFDDIFLSSAISSSNTIIIGNEIILAINSDEKLTASRNNQENVDYLIDLGNQINSQGAISDEQIEKALTIDGIKLDSPRRKNEGSFTGKASAHAPYGSKDGFIETRPTTVDIVDACKPLQKKIKMNARYIEYDLGSGGIKSDSKMDFTGSVFNSKIEVYWGDGQVDVINDYDGKDLTHTYPSSYLGGNAEPRTIITVTKKSDGTQYILKDGNLYLKEGGTPLNFDFSKSCSSIKSSTKQLFYYGNHRVEVKLSYNSSWRRVTGTTVSDKKNNKGKWKNEKIYMYNFVKATGYNSDCVDPKTKTDAKTDNRDANQSVSVTFVFSPRKLVSGDPNEIKSVHVYKVNGTSYTKVLYLDTCP